jgi:hypothetical protein
MDMHIGHFSLSSQTNRRLETPARSPRSGREFGGIITSSAMTATLDVGFARRDAAGVFAGAVSTRPSSLLTACFRAENPYSIRKNQ